ncbi:urease accessory protein UreD [Endothiovibrio diazotrophicus]
MSGGEGWKAELRLGFAARGGRTVLASRRQRGPLVVQRPFHPEGAVCHTYLLHPPGGVVGGDRLEIEVGVAAGAHALITTPGATKFYRSAGAVAHQSQRLRVAAGGALEWLPQENIFFPGADASVEGRVELGEGARFIGWEILCLGRPTIEERFEHGSARLGLQVWQDGRPLLMERLRVDGAEALARPAGLNGRPVSATLVITPADDAMLAAARAALPESVVGVVGATLVDGLLLVRFLGEQAEEARRCFIPVWQAVRPMLLDREACPPRIWAT